VLLCWPAVGNGDAIFDSLIACAELTADTARLACFDRKIEEIKKTIPKQSPSDALTTEQRFGLSNGRVLGLEDNAGQPAPPMVLHAHVESVSGYMNQRQVYVLDNMQTWQQIELDPDFPVRTGQKVTISKGALGSFWLSIDSHRSTRVKRIQ
jgi:hypothetical protein